MRRKDALLSEITRFGLGGPADLLIETPDAAEFVEELGRVQGHHIVLGGGTNLIVADEGYRGTILRYTGREITGEGTTVLAGSGADLEQVIVFAVERGLAGLESMMRIPGWLGGAVYGNAGAYGQSLHEVISRVEIFDGQSRRWISNAECGFRYRSSAFKQNKHWIVFTVELSLREGDSVALSARAEEIRATRDAKFPPTMKCAGSIFKNCFFAQLPESAQRRIPPSLVREGKVPSAFFLEQVGAKGIVHGGIRVADYHANLIYNAGGGTTREVLEVIDDLKARVTSKFGFTPEEEVQFIGVVGRTSY